MLKLARSNANGRKSAKAFTTWVIVILAALVLSGCKSNSKNSEETGPNLELVAIDANALNIYQARDAIHLDYRFKVTELQDIDVAIDFYLVHSESEEGEEIDETHFIGTVEHTSVSEGTYTESIALEIPVVTEYGNYWIVSNIDPNNDIEEIDEEDNHPNIDLEHHREGKFAAIEIDIEPSPDHEFVFVKSYIDGGLVVLDAPEAHEGTGEHHADIIGHIDAIYHGENAASAELSAQIKIGDIYQDVQLWDSEQSQYQDTQLIDFEYNGDEHFFGFDLALSDDQLTQLYATYDTDAEINELSVLLTLSDATDHGIEHSDDNNQVEITVPLFFFEGHELDDDETSVELAGTSRSTRSLTNTGNRLTIDGSYDKSYGDASKFKVGVDLGGELKVDLLEKAAALEASGDISMWIFNAKNTIFSISYDGQAYFSGLNTGYESEMVIFNTTVFEDEYWNAQFAKTFEKSWEEERILAKARFTVGPVPISVSAGISGSVAFELTLGYALSELSAEGEIFSTSMGGFANGGVDLLLVAAGVTAQLNLITNTLELESSASLALLDESVLDPRIEYEFALTDDIDVISGKFGLYADVRGVKWCKKWGIPYPCGRKTTTYYLWLYQTPSVFKKDWTLYSKEGSFSL